jgi:hypothetical protein
MKYTVEVIGWVAAAMMLSADVLLAMGKLSARSNVYHWLNVLSGAASSSTAGGTVPIRRRSSMWFGR